LCWDAQELLELVQTQNFFKSSLVIENQNNDGKIPGAAQQKKSNKQLQPVFIPLKKSPIE
jgi:hypothetical protein